jgi:hypothetical protein
VRPRKIVAGKDIKKILKAIGLDQVNIIEKRNQRYGPRVLQMQGELRDRYGSSGIAQFF